MLYTYKNGDDWGMVLIIVLTTLITWNMWPYEILQYISYIEPTNGAN